MASIRDFTKIFLIAILSYAQIASAATSFSCDGKTQILPEIRYLKLIGQFDININANAAANSFVCSGDDTVRMKVQGKWFTVMQVKGVAAPSAQPHINISMAMQSLQRLRLTGNSLLRLKNIHEKLDLSVVGHNEVILQGHTPVLFLIGETKNKIDASALTANEAEIQLDGENNAVINKFGQLWINMRGPNKLYYLFPPTQITSTLWGGAIIKAKEVKP